MTTADMFEMKKNSLSTNKLARSKKLPPPPLRLPATNLGTDEEKVLDVNQQCEQKLTNNSCLSSSSEDCPHESIPYILPACQRPQILETLMASSSVLLVPPPLETKNKRSFNPTYANRLNLLKQCQPSSKMTITDTEWIDFIRLIIHKPLKCELKSLLDKYKTTYFDQVNAPNTNDDTIRSSLCDIVSEVLTTYSSHSTVPISTTTDNSTTNMSSSVRTTTVSLENGSAKRKRKTPNPNVSLMAPVYINNQTKFVICHILHGKYDSNDNDYKTINQHQQKQFQKKYSHLFRYIPNKDEQGYLKHKGYLKSTATSSLDSSNNNNHICLMLYDEVLNNVEEYDLELSAISIDNPFTLPESILANIYPSIQ